VIPTERGTGEWYTLRPGVHAAVGKDGLTRLASWPHVGSIGRLDAGQSAVLRELCTGSRCDRVDLELLGGAGPVAHLLDQLWRGGWLVVTVTDAGRDLFTVRPWRPPPEEPPPAHEDLVLSRFAVLRRADGVGMTVESPRSWCDIDLHDPAAVAVVGDPGEARLLTPALQRLRHYLRWAGIVLPHPSTEPDELSTRQWSPHELWFHSRSRLGDRGRHGIGGTSWARDIFPPLPARPDLPPGPTIELHRPDLDRLHATDPSLTEVLESRHSTREHDQDNPLTADQLGEFLFRSARTIDTWTVEGVEHARRPYPAGGALHELELYPVVTNVARLAAGMYHYDSVAHCLREVRATTHPAVRRLVRAAGTTPSGEPAQVLLIIAARMGRLMWKYEAMAYALTLKHVGVLQQTMYCVATAMNLAVCAVGLGDDDAFTEATGHDPLVECSVGELILGSHR
jgi:SagB-type dehydrogenase family enzyme